MIIWLTGNSGSGKSTLAKAFRKKLQNWVILDGDSMRKSVSLDAGFSKEDREEHNLRVARLAKVLSEQVNVIVSVIAPFKSTKEKIDKIISCKWVYLNRKMEFRKEYPYEVPESPSLTLDVDATSVEEEVRKVVEKLRLFNVFVFGLPRSGTSMMMGICERLGVKMMHTSDTEEQLKKRNENERKRYGDNYQMNRDGFFEITRDNWTHYFEIMSVPYSGCKMIIPVRGDRLFVVRFNPGARVIQMWRDPEEMRQSQQASYKGNMGVTEEQAEIQRAMIRTKLVQQKLQLKDLGIDAIDVQYQDVLRDSTKEIKRVAEFISAPNSIDEAVGWVDPQKNRFKKEELTMNI